MKGNVIGFDADTNMGAISGHDGRRYDFATQDWRGRDTPRHGDIVDFSPEGPRATQIYLLEPEYVRLTFGQFYFSLNGRISRSQFWLRWIVPITILGVVSAAVVGGIAAAVAEGTAEERIAIVVGILIAYALIFGLATIWTDVAVLAKRVHDRNKTGWIVLFCLIPRILSFVPFAAIGTIASLVGLVVLIWFFVEFGCLRGTIGGNQYGGDPVPHP